MAEPRSPLRSASFLAAASERGRRGSPRLPSSHKQRQLRRRSPAARIGDGRAAVGAGAGLIKPVGRSVAFGAGALMTMAQSPLCGAKASANEGAKLGKRAAIGVLVVDDSALMRRLLGRIVEADPEFALVGEAETAAQAIEAVQRLKPDVVTLDINLPDSSGVAVLKAIRRFSSVPVVVITGCGEDASNTLERRVFDLGASALIPKVHPGYSAKEFSRDTIQALRTLSGVENRESRTSSAGHAEVEMVAIGASTGGTEALAVIFANLAEPLPPVLIVQHMPEAYTAAFANRLSSLGVMRVSEARDGDRLQAGAALVAPGGRHLTVCRRGGGLVTRLSDSEKMNGHRPSVDTLFQSVSEVVGGRSVAALLTGMGDDGARGLHRLREVGAHTIAQDERSSVVWGMPRVAVEIDAAVEVLPLRQIPGALLASSTRRRPAPHRSSWGD